MKKIIMATAGFMLGALPAAHAQSTSQGSAPQASGQNSSCFNTQVLNSSGATLRLSTGQTYVVAMGSDRTKVSVWQPLDNVTVCRGKGSSSQITNTNTNPPQTITAIRQ